jgi:hypothetical protein
MSVVSIATGLLALAMPGLLSRWGRTLAPAEWARTVGAALLLGITASAFGLFFVAAPVVFRSAGAHDAADVCHRMLGPSVPGGELSGLVAGALGLVIAWRIGVGGVRISRAQRTLRVEPWLGHHEADDELDLVVLPTDQLVAYAVRGPQDQVVVSVGLLRTLDEEELAAVIAHERSHLHHGHTRHLSIAAVLDAALGWIPAIGRSCRELKLVVERWADEDAGTTGAGRAALARALTKITQLDGPAPLLAFGGHCDVEARLAAISGPPPEPTVVARIGTVAPLPLLVGSLSTFLVAGSLISHHGFWGLVGLCPV